MAQSLLATDGYKFSMAEAGWPLRTETFYYSHRKGGPQVLPVDVPAFLRSLLPRPVDDDYRYLAEHSYEMGPGFKAAIVQTDALEIRALPRGLTSPFSGAPLAARPLRGLVMCPCL